MNTIKSLGFVALIISMMSVFGTAPATAHGKCPRNAGDFLGQDGKCHHASDPLAEGDKVVGQSSDDDKKVETEFRADCEAHKGVVYDAETWNAMNPGANFAPGQLHCHAVASWSRDAKK